MRSSFTQERCLQQLGKLISNVPIFHTPKIKVAPPYLITRPCGVGPPHVHQSKSNLNNLTCDMCDFVCFICAINGLDASLDPNAVIQIPISALLC